MKTIFKKSMAVLLAVIITALCFGVAVSAENKSGTCGETLTWTLDEAGTLTISGTGRMTDYEYREYPDTGINQPWEDDADNIKTVIIGDEVTGIGSYAFYYCDNLASVTIGSSVKSIGDYAFSGCTSLTKVTIPDSVTEIGWLSFHYCKSMTELNLGKGLTNMDYSFDDCRGLTSITVDANNTKYCSIDGVLFSKDKTTLIMYPANKAGNTYNIPDSVKKIENAAFYGSKNLTNVIIPDTVNEIGISAFAFSEELTSVTIGKGVTEIAQSAFNECEKLTSVTIGSGTKKIGQSAFSWCVSLKDVSIPEGVTSIDDSAFIYCEKLAEVSIPKSVTEIGRDAFHNTDLKKVKFAGTKDEWDKIKIDYNKELNNAEITCSDGITENRQHRFDDSKVDFIEGIHSIPQKIFDSLYELREKLTGEVREKLADTVYFGAFSALLTNGIVLQLILEPFLILIYPFTLIF